MAAAVFVFLPAVAERHFNGVHSPPRAVSERARALHARLLIVDLHADSLLWGRDLLQRGRRGHVDLPRLRDMGITGIFLPGTPMQDIITFINDNVRPRVEQA